MPKLATLFLVFSVFINTYTHSFEEPHSFKQKLQKAVSKKPPEWMIEQIKSDLAPYKKIGITKKSLNKLMKATQGDLPEMTVRIQIVKGHVKYIINEDYLRRYPEHTNYFYDRRTPTIRAFEKLAENIELPDVDFIVTVNDCALDRNDMSLAPIFTFSKNKYITTHVLIPDSEALANYYNLPKEIPKASQSTPWKNKIAKVFWRGSTSDGCYDAEDWRSHPRAKLVLLSLDYPDLIDAKFNNYVNSANDNVEMLAMPEIKCDFVQPKDSLRCKYLIDVDGCTCSWSRLYWTLLSNCTVFKQVTDNIEWFYGALMPNFHYVPIARDMSDLVEKIHWAKKNDRKMRIISENATKFVEENLSEEMIYLYLYLLLVRYAELQKF